MEELFKLAEEEMLRLHHPYVGTEHFMLAYLKKYGNNKISYDTFLNYILEIIGSSYKVSEYILYTPILTGIKKECKSYVDAMIKILTDEDSIAYNILLSKNEDIEGIYLDVIYK